MQGARAPALASTGTSGNPGLLDGRATHGSAGEAPGNGATVLHRLFLCFFFFRRVTGTRCSCRGGAGVLWGGGGGGAGGGQNPPPPRQWTQRRGHRLRSTNGCSTGRSTGTATHTVSGHGTPAYRRRQRRRERFPTAPPREKREGKLYGSPLLALPGYGAS